MYLEECNMIVEYVYMFVKLENMLIININYLHIWTCVAKV